MFDPRSEAVYGNGGGIQVRNTLNQSLIPTTDKFKIVSNTDILNCWQGTVLHDDFVNSTYQTEIPTSKSNDTIVFELNLMGYTNVKHMFLEIDLAGNGSSLADSASTYLQSSLAFLQNITNCKIQMGNNLMILGNEDMQDTAGINFCALDGAISPTDRDIMATLGLSRTKCTVDSVDLKDEGLYISGADLDSFARVYNQKMSFLYRVFFPSGATAIRKRINVPLSMLNPFFKRENTYLPAGLPIRITLKYMKSFSAKYGTPTVNVFKCTLGISTAAVVNRPALDFALNIESSANPKIIYMYSVLKEQVQNNYLQMWAARPLLYNSFTYGKKEIQMANDKHVDQLFMINQAMPLEIFLSVQYKNDKNKNGFDNISDGTTVFPINGSFVNLLDCDAGCMFSNLVIYANGVMIRNMPGYIQSTKLLNITTVLYGKSAEETISDINHAEQVYEGPRQTIIDSTSMNQVFSAAPFKIILAPGDIYNIHKYPIDKGTIQLRVTFDVVNSIGNTFNENYSAVLRFKHPSQLLINDRFTCVSVTWPAISNGSYQFISQTFASN